MDEPSVLNSVTLPASAGTDLPPHVDHLSDLMSEMSVVGPEGSAIAKVAVIIANRTININLLFIFSPLSHSDCVVCYDFYLV